MSEENKLILIKTSMIGMLILSFLTLAVLFYIKEWNIKITNNTLNIIIDNQGLEHLTKIDSYEIYTYNLKQAYFLNTNDKKIYLKHALDENYVNINFLITNLSIKEYLDYKSYQSNEYQIAIYKELIVICPLEENVLNIIEEINIK